MWCLGDTNAPTKKNVKNVMSPFCSFSPSLTIPTCFLMFLVLSPWLSISWSSSPLTCQNMHDNWLWPNLLSPVSWQRHSKNLRPYDCLTWQSWPSCRTKILYSLSPALVLFVLVIIEEWRNCSQRRYDVRPVVDQVGWGDEKIVLWLSNVFLS